MISTVEHEPAGTDLVAQVEEIFSQTGVLSRASNFEYRPHQQMMAGAVARALTDQKHLIVEAGTGVGKSIGYLIPAILYAVGQRKKAIVSTHTINLQEQLIGKDLPMLEKVMPVRFTYTMLKGRHNYLCTRRLARAMQQADHLFTSPDVAELKRIHEWSGTTKDGSLSDFETEPSPAVWQQVCSERGLCSPKLCGAESEFAKGNTPCFFQRARSRILASDILVLNHTLFFTLLGGLDEENKGGILMKNDFVIFDEAHTVEQVASKHVGVSVSNAQIRYALNRLYNPSTQKGLLTVLRKPGAIPLVSELLEETQKFFSQAELACDELAESAAASEKPSAHGYNQRHWTSLRIRQPDLAPDLLTLPLQRLREVISELIKLCNDKDTAQELAECNRGLQKISGRVGGFLRHDNEERVYWVERSGKGQRNLTLNVAPVDIADYLRQRLFGSESSVVMTSATLAIDSEPAPAHVSPDGRPVRRKVPGRPDSLISQVALGANPPRNSRPVHPLITNGK